MARSNFTGKKASQTTKTTKSILDKNLGTYIFIDKYGNVKQIEKEKKIIKKYYPNEPTTIDIVIGETFAIGINGEGPLDEKGATIGATKSMGVGDNIEAYAKYF